MKKNNIPNYDINIFVPSNKNNSLFLSVIFIFILFFIIIFFNPDFFLFLFASILGNFVLLLLVIGVWFIDYKWSIILFLFFSILILIVHVNSNEKEKEEQKLQNNKKNNTVTEGFDNGSGSSGGSGGGGSSGGNGSGSTGGSASGSGGSGGNGSGGSATWSSDLVSQFVNFQKVLNPNTTFDLNIVQQQATPDEVSYLFSNNKWPWSDQIQQLYKEAVAESSFLNIQPGISMIDAQQIYNENAMKELLSFNTKEGSFLLYGAVIGHNPDMPDNVNNVVRCGTDPSGNSIVQKVVYNGYNGINGGMNSIITTVDNNDIPNQINGFQFVNGTCNPCLALNNPPDYSCPFTLNTGNGNDISPIWQNLWNISSSSSTNTTNTNQFPILSQLKNELNKVDFISS